MVLAYTGMKYLVSKKEPSPFERSLLVGYQHNNIGHDSIVNMSEYMLNAPERNQLLHGSPPSWKCEGFSHESPFKKPSK